MEEEKNSTFEEVAAQFGISEEELVEILLLSGLIDYNGLPTKKAIDEGLLTVKKNVSIPYSEN